MANRWGNNGNSERLTFLGFKITAGGDCSHEIKRRLLLGRKAMTNLDGVLKSRDITLLTKICIVKAMVFPVILTPACATSSPAFWVMSSAYKLNKQGDNIQP